MARYRKIDPRIWNDEKFRSLSHEAQLAFLFVLTHPNMTLLGAFRISRSGLAEELGLPVEGFAKPFSELLAKGLLKFDERAFLVYAPNFLKYNPPDNPNVIKGWAAADDLIPECPLKIELISRAKRVAARTDAGLRAFEQAFPDFKEPVEGFAEGLVEPFSNGMANQEQEQEQEQEIKLSTPTTVSSLRHFASDAAERPRADAPRTPQQQQEPSSYEKSLYSEAEQWAEQQSAEGVPEGLFPGTAAMASKTPEVRSEVTQATSALPGPVACNSGEKSAGGGGPKKQATARAQRKTRCPFDDRNPALPEGWEGEFAEDFPSLSVAGEFGRFVNFHVSKGNVFANWKAAFRNWLTNAVKFQARDAPRSTPRSSATFKRPLQREDMVYTEDF